MYCLNYVLQETDQMLLKSCPRKSEVILCTAEFNQFHRLHKLTE